MIRSRQILALVAVSCSIATVGAAQSGSVPIGTIAVPGAPSTSTQLGGPSGGTNLVLNGDFENYSGGTCDTDLSNAAFTAMMADATGFGTANEIDVLTSSCPDGYLISGLRKVCIRRRDDGTSDAFSLRLGAPLLAGNSYVVGVLVQPEAEMGPVELGVSDDANSFGILIHTIVPKQWVHWELSKATFVSPLDAEFVTVRAAQFTAWSHVDAITLTPPGFGEKYCVAADNHAGFPADLAATGSASVAAGDLALAAAPVTNQPGIFFHGWQRTETAFGCGYLCVTGGVFRGAVVFVTGNVATYAYDNSNDKHSLVPFVGGVRNFQYWYRNEHAAGCTWNLSNALGIAIEP